LENLELRVPYKLIKIITIVAKNIMENGVNKQLNYEDMNFCLYTKEYEKLASTDTVCYLDDYPDVDDEDREIYSSFVVEEKLEFFFSGENLEAVIGNALYQKDKASIAEFIAALNYYIGHDAFIQF